MAIKEALWFAFLGIQVGWAGHLVFAQSPTPTAVESELPCLPDTYLYRAEVNRVVDGDTVDLRVDLGFNIVITERFRLLDINTPELRTRNLIEKQIGHMAKDRLTELLAEGEVWVESVKVGEKLKGKYGRYLGTLYVNGVNLNQQLVREGLAHEYDPKLGKSSWKDVTEAYLETIQK